MVGVNNAHLLSQQSAPNTSSLKYGYIHSTQSHTPPHLYAPHHLPCRRLKSAHLKKKADEALKDGKHRIAWETYTEAIDISPEKHGLSIASLYSNRSLAYYKAHRYDDALHDADSAIQLAPSWSKGHWRRGTALISLNRIPSAVDAFYNAWQCERETVAKKECRTKLYHAVQKLTREDLGECIMKLFEEIQGNDVIRKEQVEVVDASVLREAAFRIITDAHKGQPKPGIYYEKYFSWRVDTPMTAVEAYVLRSEIYCRARCYLQAASDAQDAIDLILHNHYSTTSTHNDSSTSREYELSVAYTRLGIACMAEKNHVDQCAKKAFKAFSKAIELDSDNQDLRDRLQQATELLTKETLEQARWEIYNEGVMPMPHTTTTSNNNNNSSTIKRVFRADITLSFPSGTVKALTSTVREALRRSIATSMSVSVSCVTLERVLPPRPPSRQYLQLTFHVSLQEHDDVLHGNTVVQSILQKEDSALLSNMHSKDAIQHALGCVDSALCCAEMVDITPAHMTGQLDTNNHHHDNTNAIIVPSPPKLELEVPYKMYRLVTANGVAVERTDKHPFCMSRVYYDASEKPEEIWTELADNSCRWRQTGSEIRIIALQVPRDLPPRDLCVVIEPFHLSISNKISKQVYLQGTLHRGIVPEDSYWTHCGGTGEDGCCITLQKMNLEVLQRHWMHSEMWWTKLFEHHSEIAWDDYEKDYSDLPEEVLSKHRIAEAIKEEQKHIEHVAREKREMLQQADDVRKKRRQERLRALRRGLK